MGRPGPARALAFAMAAIAASTLVAHPARAATGLELSGSLGRTFAILGNVHRGGEAFQIDALVPARPSWSVGYAFFGADMGQRTVRLLDPNDGTDLGAVGAPTRYAYGTGIALDVHPWAGAAGGPGLLRGLAVSGTAGEYWIRLEEQGETLEDGTALGWALAARWRHALSAHSALGPWVRYTRVFDERLGRFMSGGVEWTWR